MKISLEKFLSPHLLTLCGCPFYISWNGIRVWEKVTATTVAKHQQRVCMQTKYFFRSLLRPFVILTYIRVLLGYKFYLFFYFHKYYGKISFYHKILLRFSDVHLLLLCFTLNSIYKTALRLLHWGHKKGFKIDTNINRVDWENSFCWNEI